MLIGREEFNPGHRPEQADDVAEDCRQENCSESFHSGIRYGVNWEESMVRGLYQRDPHHNGAETLPHYPHSCGSFPPVLDFAPVFQPLAPLTG